MKDLIIGAASNYTWDQLKYWVNSIQKTSFDGDIVVVGRNIPEDTIKNLTARNVIVELYQGESNLAPHVEKFFFVWDYLNRVGHYKNIYVTDTRDVIFQKNPSDRRHPEAHMGDGYLYVEDEGLKYADEPWGSTNYIQAFGPYFFDRIKDKGIINVGVIGGNQKTIKNLMMMVFQLSFNRPIRVCDQASFNFLLHETSLFDDISLEANIIHLGTTPLAVEAGSGDLGALAFNSEEVKQRYYNSYYGPHPYIENGLVLVDEEVVNIVHQWDRVPEIKKLWEEKYA